MRDERPLATRVQVAEYLNLPAGTLTQWAHRGIGPKYKRVGRHARYSWSDVDSWLAQQQEVGGAVA